MHSHFLPGLDDGVASFEEAVETIRFFAAAGYKKVITSPHIMSDYYRNSPETILPKLEELRNHLAVAGLDIIVDSAAEYYLDEGFIEKLKNGQKLMTFGANYLLFETSYINKPNQLNSVIFDMLSAGYKPVMVHPERYQYVERFEEFQEMKGRGLLFQININSLTGHYSGNSKKFAELLIDNQMVNFLGSDCHGPRHLQLMEAAFQTKYYKKALELPLINYSLL
ncbi:MAG: capsular biosynthesis protein [Cytophagales bacterium]|nr:capsular biosynthesis protein [Cytophagales bacterium]